MKHLALFILGALKFVPGGKYEKMDPILVAFLGYVLGCVFRTTYDFLWKKLEADDVTFDSKYLTTMIISVILSIMTAMVTFSEYTWPGGDLASLFFQALTTGFVLNHLVNKPVSYIASKVK